MKLSTARKDQSRLIRPVHPNLFSTITRFLRTIDYAAHYVFLVVCVHVTLFTTCIPVGHFKLCKQWTIRNCIRNSALISSIATVRVLHIWCRCHISVFVTL